MTTRTESSAIAPKESPDVWTDFDRSFDELRSRFFGRLGFVPFPTFVRSSAKSGISYRPARTDVADTGKAFQVTAEIPGIPKDRLDIRIRGSTVEIRGESEQRAEAKQGEYVHRERAYQGFYRVFELPEPVVGSDAKAKVENGVLTLELPKQTPTPSPAEVRVKVQ